MGGRGASSGVSKYGNPYGSQYHTVLEVDNIKFVEKNSRQSESLMETQTDGRIYVHVESGDLKSIVFFDENNKRNKQVDIDHLHKGLSPHTHEGYDTHGEGRTLSKDEQAMYNKVVRIWDNNKRGK